MECKPKIIDKMIEDFDNLEQKMKYNDLSRFESTSRNSSLENIIPKKLSQGPKVQENEFEEYEKQMNQVLRDVLKKQPTKEEMVNQEIPEEDPPETILEMLTVFIHRMWEGF